MKVAVLFGSFNPFTNAHLAAMKNAKAAIGADLGLYVATNGDYLRYKTLKHNESFYLTEEERKGIVENVCKEEPGLAFWGFELGGASPKRYKTLCEIKKQYPDAEIYEIEGADKLKSLSKLRDSEDYVSNTRFLIIGRDDLDAQAIIDTDPLLKQYKNSFTILPPISETTISSTEVRHRFFAGVNYDSLVPKATAELLKTRKPEDFALSFVDKMKHMIKNGGMFGEKNARLEVYKENLRLFLDWKHGIDDGIDFGDYDQFLNETELYTEKHDVSQMGTVYQKTLTGCANMDCVDMAEELIRKGHLPAILNLASAHRPGGGYDRGSKAQEEALCRSSNLSVSLYQFGDPKKMKCIKACDVPTKRIGYPFDLNYGGIYTPNVTFFRHGKPKFYGIRENPFKCGVITVAALSFNDDHQYSDDSEKRFRTEDGAFTAEGNEVMLNKIRTIFRMGVEHGHDSLVLGAFGCGVYQLPVAEVSRQFRTVMEEPEFKNKFKMITFAILEGSRGPREEQGKYAGFYQEFGRCL